MFRVPISKVEATIPHAALASALGDGRAIVRGWEVASGESTTYFGVIGDGRVALLHRARKEGVGTSQVATDGTRVAVVGRDELVLWDSVDRAPKRLPIKGRTKDSEILDACLVPGEDALWMILSDPFWVVVGRYVARVTWKGKDARYARVTQPFPYRPYDHSGVFSVAIGAASSRDVWVYAEDQNGGALLRRVGARGGAAVKVPRGAALFDPVARALAITPKKRATSIAIDGAGTAHGRVAVPTGAQLSAMCGRHRWARTKNAFVRALATDDLPSLASAPKAAATPPFRVREQVVGWALDEPADLRKPGPVVELEIGEDVLVFRKSSGKKKRFFFDFSLRAIRDVTWKPVRGDRVLMEIVTPSGKTRAVCTESFAGLLRTSVAHARRR